MSEIEYTTVEQQIEILKSQNLIIQNEEYAKKRLELYGYSNLIKNYRDPYLIRSEGKNTFRSGVTFEQICSLYIFDKNLRNAVMASMLDLEELIKESAADIIAQSFGTNPEEYLQYKNYQNKRKGVYRFTLAGILDTLKKTLDTDKNPISHYQTVYGTVPPWILFKSVYLSTIVNFINLLKPAQKEMMVKKLYPVTQDFAIKTLANQMLDTLFICLEYRNAAAHGGRIYNFECKRKLRIPADLPYSSKGFSQLLQLLSVLKYQGPYSHLKNVLDHQLNTHCNNYPQDVTYLGQILNINISAHEIAWVSNNSNKYHSNPHCSGMQNAKQVDLEEAQKRGYIKCKKCC